MNRKVINFTFAYVKTLLVFLAVFLGVMYFSECTGDVCTYPGDEPIVGFWFVAFVTAFVNGTLREDD